MKEVLWSFTYIKEKTVREKYKETYILWGKWNPVTRLNMDAKAFIKQKNFSSEARRITTVEIYKIKENIRLTIRNATGVIGDKMNANVTEHHKREQGNDYNGFGNVENHKYPSAEEEQHTVRNKLNEDFQIMWHKVRIIQKSEREKLPILKTNSKLIKLEEKINGLFEEFLEED